MTSNPVIDGMPVRGAALLVAEGLDTEQFDPEILELIPHRPPMLLINRIASLAKTRSSAIVNIDHESPFYEAGLGVPSWIGLEYMGQTAALIAGFQLREGICQPHLGFIMASRAYKASLDYFTQGAQLLVSCEEVAVVGDTLATFKCSIVDNNTQQQLAEANLSVFRKPINA